MNQLLSHIEQRQPQALAWLKQLVECESPSRDTAALEQWAALFTESVSDIATVKRVSCGKEFGSALLCEFQLPGPKVKRGPAILGVGHSDTVWAKGTLAKMPFRVAEGRVWGPGTLDMKAGLVFFVEAMRAIKALNLEVRKPVRLWIVPDEEIGSDGSRAHTEKQARGAEAVLVLEPGTGLEGKLKTARKGVGDYFVRVKGKGAHAGVDFTSGASAIVELAHQIGVITGFTDLSRGLTVNPGVIRGGTRTNVIADEAEAEIDIRIARMKDAAPLDRRFHRLKALDRRCSVEVTGGLNRPPMERTSAIARLFKTAQMLAKDHLGIELEESATGGGSDGNFTAALGIPTLDGLGPVGEGAHAPHESFLLDRMADRTALLALLAAHLGQSK